MNPFILVQMALYGLPTAIKFVKIKVKAYNEFIAIYYTLLYIINYFKLFLSDLIMLNYKLCNYTL